MSIETIATQPPEHGDNTVDGLLGRSDSRVGKRYGHFKKRLKKMEAEADGVWSAKETTAADVMGASAHRHREEEVQRDNPGYDRSASIAKAIEAEKVAKEIDADQGRKLSAIQSIKHVVAEHYSHMMRYLAGHKTGPGLEIVESAVYSADIDDPLAARAARMATLADRQERREIVDNSYRPAEVAVRTLLQKHKARAASARIEIHGLYGERRGPSFSLPMVNIRAQPAPYAGHSFTVVPDVEALACRYWHDEIAADIKARVAEEYASIPPEMILDADERRKLLRSLDAEILELQREIADLTWAAIDEGHDIDFPADLPARAILGVR